MISLVRISERSKTLILLVIMAILILAFYEYIYIPQEQSIKVTRDQASVMQDKLEMAKKIEEEPSFYQQEIMKSVDQAAPVLAALPNDGDASRFAIQIEELANQNNVSFVEYKTDKPQTKPNYRQIPIVVTLSGEYGNLVNFIKGLDDMPRIITYRGWDIKGSENSLSAYTVKLEIMVYSSR